MWGYERNNTTQEQVAPSPKLGLGTGHGHFDMASYDRYFAGKLEDYEYPEEAIKESLAHLPKVG